MGVPQGVPYLWVYLRVCYPWVYLSGCVQERGVRRGQDGENNGENSVKLTHLGPLMSRYIGDLPWVRDPVYSLGCLRFI